MQLGDLSNPELRMLTDQLEKIRFGGDEATVRRISIRGLLPDTEHYMTYEGSTTAPACHETVTWMVLNKPIYITKQQVRKRDLTQKLRARKRASNGSETLTEFTLMMMMMMGTIPLLSSCML